MKILGIDASATSTGVVLLDSSEPGASLFWAVQPKTKGFERNLMHFEQFTKVLKAYTADVAVIEAYAHSGPGRKHVLVEVGTMYRLALHLAKIPWVEINPSTLKKYVSGDGHADKECMSKAVKRRWGFSHECDDVVDAYALAGVYAEALGYHQENSQRRLNDYQKGVLKGLDISIALG